MLHISLPTSFQLSETAHSVLKISIFNLYSERRLSVEELRCFYANLLSIQEIEGGRRGKKGYN